MFINHCRKYRIDSLLVLIGYTLHWLEIAISMFYLTSVYFKTLRWRHNGRDSVSIHQPRDCLLNRLFRRRSKKTSKPRVTGLCAGNSPWTGEFPAQMASNAENVSIWWRHHDAMRYRHRSVAFLQIKYDNHLSLSVGWEIWQSFVSSNLGWSLTIEIIVLGARSSYIVLQYRSIIPQNGIVWSFS